MEFPVPSEVADLLRGRPFANFDEFRSAFWKALASVPRFAREFSSHNRALMSRGQAPKAAPAAQVPGNTILHLRHVRPIAQGGAVYDVDNIRVISPLRHYQYVCYGGLNFASGPWRIDTNAFRKRLIATLERLLGEDDLHDTEVTRLIDEFEENACNPCAADLIFCWRPEFRNIVELVDFALACEEPKKVSGDQLIALAQRLMTADIANAVQSERLSMQFKASIPHPDGDGLIFYPKIEFKTPKELVDYAVSYKPPQK
jgi:hypothetical protein